MLHVITFIVIMESRDGRLKIFSLGLQHVLAMYAGAIFFMIRIRGKTVPQEGKSVA